MTTNANWTTAAQDNIDETGCDPSEDIAAIRSGAHTRETLLALCLDQAGDDRVEGWRDYVDEVCRLADEPTTIREYTTGSRQHRYEDVVDAARQDAADVLTQWDGVDIDWSATGRELRAHWTYGGPAAASDDYLDLVAREIDRLHARG